jgi:hypothetical protein
MTPSNKGPVSCELYKVAHSSFHLQILTQDLAY